MSASSFEHDFVEDASGAVQKELSTMHSDTANPEHKRTVWKAKVNLSQMYCGGKRFITCLERREALF